MYWLILNGGISFLECFLFLEFVTRYNRMDATSRLHRSLFITTWMLSLGAVLLTEFLEAGMQARLLVRTALVFLYSLYCLEGTLISKVVSCLFFPCMLAIAQALTGAAIARILNIPLRAVIEGLGLYHVIYHIFTLLILYYATRVFLRFRDSYRYPYKKIYILITSLISIISITFVCIIIDILMESTTSNSTSMLLIFAIASILSVNLVIYHLYGSIGREGRLESENQMLRQYLQYEHRHMEDLKKMYESIRRLRHEMKNHLNLIEQKLIAGDTQQALEQIQEIRGHIRNLQTTVQTDNETLNFIINSHLALAAEHQISCKVQISNTRFLISDIDLHSMLGNMLTNAIEASSVLDITQRDLIIHISIQRGYHSFTVKNKIDTSILQKNPDLITTKKDLYSHGFGVSVIRAIAAKYQGHEDFYEQDGYFCVQVLLPDSQREETWDE